MGHLELRAGPRRVRHFLEGKRLHQGDIVEILLADGRWMRGRFDRAQSGGDRTAKLYTCNGSRTGAWLWVRESDLLRWPAS